MMEENKKNYFPVFILIFMVIVLIVGGFFSFRYIKPFFSGIFGSNKVVVTPKSTLEQKQKNTIPGIDTTKKGDPSDLDVYLNFLIIEDSSNLVIYNNAYTDGTKGYSIVYQHAVDVNTDSQKFIGLFNQNSFKIVYAQRDAASFSITGQNENYLVEVSGQTNNRVTIKIQKKYL